MVPSCSLDGFLIKTKGKQMSIQGKLHEAALNEVPRVKKLLDVMTQSDYSNCVFMTLQAFSESIKPFSLLDNEERERFQDEIIKSIDRYKQINERQTND